MKLNSGLIALTLAFGSSAMAADIYVRDARGSNLTNRQLNRITQEVERAVTRSGEHTLSNSERSADFVLQPSLVIRGSQTLLRVEREADGEVVAMSEQPVSASQIEATDAASVTEIALQDDEEGSVSGVTSEDQGAMEYPVGGTSNLSDNSSSYETDSANEPRLNRQASSGDIRAPSPGVIGENRPGYFHIGLGNSFGMGLETDEVMYKVNAGYNYNFSQMFTGKAFVDANLGTGAESARFVNLAVGGEFYPEQDLFTFGAPYLGADIGFAFVRDGEDRTQDAPALGAGAGFKFQALQLNWDLNLRYTYLTDEIDGSNPSIVGGHVAVNF
ncbi:MAG: hypothetical protein V4692_05975 [Bdellovibrionota bacterium]